MRKHLDHNLKAKLKNSGFGLTIVNYLSHVIKVGTVDAYPRKVSPTRDWPILFDIKKYLCFLGLENY